MAKTSGQFEQEFIQTAKEKTGKTLEQWLPVLKASGLSRQMELVGWLKSEHKFNHLQATLLAGIYLNNGKPVYMNEDNLLESQFTKCPEMRPLFETISEKILTRFKDTQLIPKKTYLSFTAVREFAAINAKPKEIRLGVDLGEEPFQGIVQKSKLTGPMPRISHMIILTDAGQLNKEVMECIERSYNRTNKK